MATAPDQTLSASTVLLAGASSQIGVYAIPRLLESGFNVIAVGRRGKPPGWPDLQGVRWLDEPGAMEAAPGCRYLLSAGPMDLAHRLLEVPGQLHGVVAFSSTSAQTKIDSDNQREKELARQLLDLESRLQSSARAKDVKLVILRPTLVYGCGLDTNISLLAKWIRRFGFAPVNGKATGLRQPVHAEDLASLAVKAIQGTQNLPGILTVAGGETLSYSEMVSRIFPVLGRPIRLLRLPGWLFAFLVSEMVKRQNIDLFFDDHEARELLDYDPRPFNLTISDFHLPDS